MKRLIMLAAPVALMILAGCVVAPARGYYYYHPRALVVAPAPAVIIRP
jgi:hypothetical protein